VKNIIELQGQTHEKLIKNIDKLSILPKEKLYGLFEIYRQKATGNYSSINFLLWGEALIEEISARKLSKEFEDALSA